MTDKDFALLVRQALQAAEGGDADVFTARGDELQSLGWDNSDLMVLETLIRATEALPSVSADAAAEIATRISERFAPSLEIVRPIMEAVIRGAAGEESLYRGVPRNVVAAYSLLAVGQIVHDGYLSVDEALGSSPPADSPTVVSDQGGPEPQ